MLSVLAGCSAASGGHHGALVTHVTTGMCIPASRRRLDSKPLYVWEGRCSDTSQGFLSIQRNIKKCVKYKMGIVYFKSCAHKDTRIKSNSI